MNVENRLKFKRIKAEIEFLGGVVDKSLLSELAEMVDELFESVDSEIAEYHEELVNTLMDSGR